MAGDRFKFEAGQFKTDPINGDEAAEHRAMRREIEDAWPILQDTAGVLKTIKMIPKLIAIGASIFALSAAISAIARLYGVGP